MRAALLRSIGDDTLEVVENMELTELGPTDVKVEIRSTGVCHSDLHFVDGFYPYPAPAILGHEAAGVVEEVGDHLGQR